MILSNDSKYRGNLGSILKLDEYSHVEKPFLEQLAGLGWEVLELKMQQQPEQNHYVSKKQFAGEQPTSFTLLAGKYHRF
jgi:type I restriction enzyme, R subunit